MEIKRNFTVDQPIEKVWELLGEQFGQVCTWASGVHQSEGQVSSDPSTRTGGTRACQTDFGQLKERVDVYDPANHRLTYTAYAGFPFFVDNMQNTWRLSARGPRRTEVDIHLVGTMKGFVGKLMGPVMKGQMGKAMDQVAIDFKTYAETGQASAHKQKELAKRARKAA